MTKSERIEKIAEKVYSAYDKTTLEGVIIIAYSTAEAFDKAVKHFGYSKNLVVNPLLKLDEGVYEA